MKVPLDNVINKLAGLGVPGLILLFIMATNSLAGGAAIVVALAALGGPFGILGGIAALGVIVMTSHAVSDYGFDLLFTRLVDKLILKGHSKQEILATIDRYPISKKLKRKLREAIESHFPSK